MKITCVLLCAIVSFLLAGEAFSWSNDNIEIYTFKKDRVDQELSGNRGYVSGNVPVLPEKEKRSTQRTLIGIDIALPVGDAKVEEENIEEQSTKTTVRSVTQEVQVGVTFKVEPEPRVEQKIEIIEEDEDDWIK